MATSVVNSNLNPAEFGLSMHTIFIFLPVNGYVWDREQRIRKGGVVQ